MKKKKGSLKLRLQQLGYVVEYPSSRRAFWNGIWMCVKMVFKEAKK